MPPSRGPIKERTLLAVLLLEASRTVTLDRLVDALWSERPPTSAVANVRTYVARVRRLFAEIDGTATQRLLTKPGGYELKVAPGEPAHPSPRRTSGPGLR